MTKKYFGTISWALKIFGVSLFVVLMALNALLGLSLFDSESDGFSKVLVDDSTFSICAADVANQCYAVQPSVLYSSIDKSRERRRSFSGAASLCFAWSGAFCVFAAAIIAKFYEAFIRAFIRPVSGYFAVFVRVLAPESCAKPVVVSLIL